MGRERENGVEKPVNQIEWWSGLDGPNGLTSAPMSYDLMTKSDGRNLLWIVSRRFMKGLTDNQART